MIQLIPTVKHIETYSSFCSGQGICYEENNIDSRLLSALKKLPYDKAGAKLDICIAGHTGEGYELSINENDIRIQADGPAGAFYAVQTLRQIFKSSEIPCLYIKDFPDFEYRGFYHDVTRGKIPTVETIKKLIDQMAYYKLNSLQLYVEHTFEFEEYKDLNASTGCMTKEDLLEIGAYCRENFIDFIPSLSTFGHLYELLEQPQYKHLRVLKNYETEPNFWHNRMAHHTLDPENPQSIALVESLIDQYIPCFDSEWFNICCDETFDLHSYDTMGVDSGKLYVEFVKKMIAHVQEHGKKVMMWADILLKYPHTIDQIPNDTCFLNWCYQANPTEENIIRLAQKGKAQIVCPGTTTWSRLCEYVDVEEQNICRMAEYGYQHGALGVLNTNWGDWGNPCSLELAMYGLVLGAEKSWSVNTSADNEFYNRVNALLYENENGILHLKEVSRLHTLVNWNDFCRAYFYHRYGHESDKKEFQPDLTAVQKAYAELSQTLSGEQWVNDEYRQEMLLAAEGICVIAELWTKLLGNPVSRLTDTRKWLQKYSEKWLQKNQPNELYRIREMFEYCEEI